ncbi:VPLPA-CTERM sorting domain-containing protein [Litoreibacter roseus]|uniref:Uncharacterized protein n=1 Tax=Litoreibacter roseus TaxID=2601869 RepID=A0A6N6JE94_9RHOB|nr:VPLPA-CTERM sorting domain-containing protein [Litoreibacter roseus]GFE63532.1 hypothetical protein KIN_06060 [Litoreibacter roseus]
MNKLLAALAVAPVLFGAGFASAATISPTGLLGDGTVNATVNIEDDSGLLNDANWFTFYATAGQTIDIDINREERRPDLAAELYLGDVTGSDFGTRSGNYGTVTPLAGLTFIDREDDTEQDAFNGPWGDPRFTFTATDTGVYSFFVVSLNTQGVGADFSVTATGIDSIEVVPLPAGGLLLATALAGFGIARRRSAKK